MNVTDPSRVSVAAFTEPADSATTTNPRAEFVGEHLGETSRIFFIIISSLEIIIGVAGNGLLLTVLLRSRSLRKRGFHYAFIANLALADLVNMGYWMTFFVLDLIIGRHPVANEAHCVANAFVIYSSAVVSILSLLSISVNRYLHVCHHHLYSRVFSLPRVIVWCLLLWVVGAVSAFPPLVGAGDYGYERFSHTCADGKGRQATYSKLVGAFFSVVPMILVGCLNVAIFRKWRQTKLDVGSRFPLCQGLSQNSLSLLDDQEQESTFQGSLQPSQPRERSGAVVLLRCRVMSFFMGDNAPSWAVPDLPENERKTASAQDVQKPFKETTLEKYRSRVLKERAKEKAFVRSLLVVFLLMVFCFLPFGITLIVMIYDADRPLSPEAYISCVLLLFFSSSVNWIVYGLMNRSFRHAYFKLVRRMFGRCCCRRPPSPIQVENDLPLSFTSGMVAGRSTCTLAADYSGTHSFTV